MEEQEGLTQSSEQKSHNGYKLVQSSIKQSYTALKKTSELQKKIERQRDVARRTASFTDQPGKKSHFVSRS
ncbi:protein FAM219A, partial [Biomphalaria glabrata]